MEFDNLSNGVIGCANPVAATGLDQPYQSDNPDGAEGDSYSASSL